MENINQAVYLEKLTTPTLAEDIDTLAVCESYSGVDNPIHFKTLNVAQFSCGFDIIVENYPFGRQNCTMSFFITKNDNSLTNLTVGTLVSCPFHVSLKPLRLLPSNLLTYAIKNQRKARNAPSRGHFVPKPLVGGFGCLELVLYGIRELA